MSDWAENSNLVTSAHMDPVDCLIIGYNDMAFGEYVHLLRSMGEDHPDFRDLNLNFIEYEGIPYRALDIFSRFHFEQAGIADQRPFHNGDLLWMVISYLGTYLSDRGLTFDYVNLFQAEKDSLREKLTSRSYGVVAVTTTIYNFDQPIGEVVSFVRSWAPEARIVIGGPFISKRYEKMMRAEFLSLLKYLDGDFYVCCREGEETLARLIWALKKREDLSGIANLAFRHGSGYLLTEAQPESNSLEDTVTNYSLFPPEQVGGFANIRISKGCPYSCSFCGFPTRTHRYRHASLDRIRLEMAGLKQTGTVESILFIDDSVNVPPGHFKNVLRMMIRERYQFRWNCFLRCDHVDHEMIALMKESGCEGVFLGLESANRQILSNMNKSVDPERYRAVIPEFKRAGIIVFVSIFVGFPGETPETLEETLQFLRETEPDFYRPQLWYCDPVTPVWRNREKYQLRGTSFGWKHATMDASLACDLMEHALLSLDTPVWTPDPGYNFTSLYLMRQRGISFEWQREFLRSFNAVVKEKVLSPRGKAPDRRLMDNLRRSCGRDWWLSRRAEPAEALGASNYCRAVRAMSATFAGTEPAVPGLGESAAGAMELVWSELSPVSRELSLRLALCYPRAEMLLHLVAYGWALRACLGKDATNCLISNEPGLILPIRLECNGAACIRDAMAEMRRSLDAAAPWRPFAGYVTNSPLWEQWHRGFPPGFPCALVWREWQDDHVSALRRAFRRVFRATSLWLIATRCDGELRIGAAFAQSKHRRSEIAKLLRVYEQVLRHAAYNDHDIPWSPPADAAGERSTVPRGFAGARFNF